LLAFCVVVGWVSTSAAPAQAPAPAVALRVAVVGDSVLLGARDQLLARFVGTEVTVDAEESLSLLGAIDRFRRSPAPLADVVVLDLGYNDSDDPIVFRERIDAAMAALAGVGRVIWLNQSVFSPGRAAMNAELLAARGRSPTLDVVDWSAEVTTHPEYVYGDAIHLTPAGQAAMATLVRQRFDSYVDSLRPPTTTTVPATTVPNVPSRPPAAAVAPRAERDDAFGVDSAWVIGAIAGAVLVGGMLVALTIVVGRRRSRS
jgi:hypothetical protein